MPSYFASNTVPTLETWCVNLAQDNAYNANSEERNNMGHYFVCVQLEDGSRYTYQIPLVIKSLSLETAEIEALAIAGNRHPVVDSNDERIMVIETSQKIKKSEYNVMVGYLMDIEEIN
jgi:hypothetical protein